MLPRLIDLQPKECAQCGGSGSVRLPTRNTPAPWSVCSACEGIGRLWPDGKPARVSAVADTFAPPPMDNP